MSMVERFADEAIQSGVGEIRRGMVGVFKGWHTNWASAIHEARVIVDAASDWLQDVAAGQVQGAVLTIGNFEHEAAGLLAVADHQVRVIWTTEETKHDD